jgi:hypothetical protein
MRRRWWFELRRKPKCRPRCLFLRPRLSTPQRRRPLRRHFDRSPRAEPLEDRRLLSATANDSWLQESVPGDDGIVSQLGVSAGFPSVYDFGDAPDSYGTTLAAGGAFHSPFGPVLGPSGDRDWEANGFPTLGANGDDFNIGTLSPGPVPAGDDERGVFNFKTDGVSGPPSTLIFRQLGSGKGSVDIQVNNLVPTQDDVILFFPAYVSAYIDWNRDGDFHDKNERVLAGAQVTKNGTATYAFTIPDSATVKAGPSFMRVRVHSAFQNPIVLPPGGHANDGEVEDYAITLQPQLSIFPDQFENNDTSATATDLGSGDKTFTGLTIDAGGDDDWYRWLAPATGKLSVGVIFEQEPGRDVDLYLHEAASGITLASSTLFFENEQVMIEVAAGQSYLIRVYGGSIHPNYALVIDGPNVEYAADFNMDGRVDGNDMLILQTGVGITSGARHADGDADADGDVDVADFQIWQKEYNLLSAGAGAVATRAAASSVNMLSANDDLDGNAVSMSVDLQRSGVSRLKAPQARPQFAEETAQHSFNQRSKSSRLEIERRASQSENVRDAIDRYFELLSERRSLLELYWY